MDIYALGVVLYEMVTGRKPYTADTPMAVLIMHARDPLPNPKKIVPNLPDSVEKILLKAMAKEPEHRFQTMNEVAAGFKAILIEQNRTSETLAEKAAEEAIREKAALEASPKAELESKENSEREKIKRESAEQARQKRIEGQAASRAERQARITKTNNVFKTVISKASPFMKIGGVLAFILFLFWAGSQILPNFLTPVPTATIAITPSPSATNVPAFTNTPYPSATQTTASPTPVLPRELSLETIASIQELGRIGDGKFNALDWSLDGEHFAIASSIGVYLFESATGKELLSFRTDASVEKIALSMERQLVAVTTLGKDSEVQVWDLKSSRIKQTITVGHPVRILEFDPSGHQLVTTWMDGKAGSSSTNGVVQIWDSETGSRLQLIDTIAENISINSDGSLLATVVDYYDTNVYIWDMQSGTLQKSIPTGARYVSSVLFHPTQKQTITWVETLREKGSAPDPCGCGSYVYSDIRRFYNLSDNVITMSINGAPLTFSADGEKYASMVRDSSRQSPKIGVYQVGESKEIAAFENPTRMEGYRLSLDQNSVRLLYFEGEPGRLKLSSFNIAGGETTQIMDFDFTEYGITALAEVKGNGLAALDGNGEISIFSSRSGEYLNSFRSASKSDFLSILPFDDDTLMAGLRSGEIEFWDTNSWTLTKTISGRQNGEAESLALSPSREELAVSGYTILAKGTANITGGKTILWNIETGEAVQTMYPKYVITDTEFSMDGAHVIGAAEFPDHTIYDWDPVTGKLLGSMDYRIDGFTKEPVIATIALSPDNRTLAVGFSGFPKWGYSYSRQGYEYGASPEGPPEIQIWDLETYTLVKTLAGHSLSIHALEFNPDGKMLMSGSTDGTIKAWNVETSELLTTLSGHGETVTDILFDLDGLHFYSASQDGTLITWGNP